MNGRHVTDRVLEFQRQISATYEVDCAFVAADVSDADACRNLVESVIQRFETVDVLVNNAGPYIFDHKPLVEHTVDEWRAMLDGNLSAVFFLCKHAIPAMRRQRNGRIINVGFTESAHGAGWPGRSAYAAAKVGLTSLTRTLALEEKQFGITVNMVCPGDITGSNKEKFITDVQSGMGTVGRPGAGEDVARVIRFLCDEDSDYVTGAVVEVNGGVSLSEIET